MTALTKDEFTAGIAELKESITAAVGDGFVASLTTALKEAFTPAPVEAAGEEPIAAVEITKVVEAAEEQEPEVDQAELATKFAESGLPVAVLPNIVTAIKEGKTVAEAIESQTKLREAFAQSATITQVKITEADRPAEGDLRSQILSAVRGK